MGTFCDDEQSPKISEQNQYVFFRDKMSVLWKMALTFANCT